MEKGNENIKDGKYVKKMMVGYTGKKLFLKN